MTHKYLLVFSASIGSGHNQAARAFIAAWEKQYPGQSRFIDFLAPQTIPDRFSQWAYEFMIQHCPWLYEILYRLSDLALIGPILRWQTGLFCSRRIQEAIQESQTPPAGLVFTHPTPANAASALKQNKKISEPLIGIVTDFALHQLWKDTHLDLYIVPHEEFVQPLIDLGISAERICPAGIPIGEPFWNPNFEKATTEKMHILIAGGGWGMGPLKETCLALEALSTPCKITLIAGKNSALEADMKTHIPKTKHQLEVVGFTPEIHRYMQEADLFITKAGGLSTSESFASDTPLLLLPGRAGQEKDNCLFFHRYGAALYVDNISEIPAKVEDLLQSPNKIQTLMENAKKLGKPNSALHTAQAIEKLLKESK